MNVLVVDDQINVVSGIVFGVDWDGIGVSGVYKAYNAMEAKNILRNHPIDIILCDIEMPMEDGITLLKWVKQQELEAECIFLTAHADFIYAKSAMQLGCFDYILQPARYSDIENVILRAKQKIARERENKKYYLYGKMLYKDRGKIEDGIVSDWYRNPFHESYFEKVKKLLAQDDNRASGDKNYVVFLLSILKMGEDKKEEWDMDLLKYSCLNILTEIFEKTGHKLLLNIVGGTIFCGFLWGEGGKEEDVRIQKGMQEFLTVSKDFFGYDMAVYLGQQEELEKADMTLERLKRLLNDNVALKATVHTLEDGKEEYREGRGIDYNIWLNLMQKGFGKRVYEEAVSYLDQLMAQDQLNASRLRKFYNEFMKMVYALETKMKISFEDIFADKEEMDKALLAYQNVDTMKNFIKHITAHCCQDEEDSENTGRQIDKIKQYIYQNLDKDIRRDDIALEVFLNPNYVSRLFKKQEGISLKEFIVREKMKTAQVLIRTTELPISIIAVRVGYSNFSHFSQVYKKMFGVSPTEERK